MPNNQQYIEEIIKVAQEGGYNYTFAGSTASPWDKAYIFLDPNFFRAIGKVKVWKGDYQDEDGNWRMFYTYEKTKEPSEFDRKVEVVRALTFYEINLTKDLDHAIEWLYKLIKE